MLEDGHCECSGKTPASSSYKPNSRLPPGNNRGKHFIDFRLLWVCFGGFGFFFMAIQVTAGCFPLLVMVSLPFH